MSGLTSREIITLQHRLGLLFDRGGAIDDPVELAEIDAEVEGIYEALEGAVSDRLDSLRHVVKRLEGEVQTIRGEERVLADARRARAKAIKRVRGWMLQILQGHRLTHGQVTVRGVGHTYWVGRTRRLEKPTDPALWPVELRREKREIVFDHERFRELTASGADLPVGFELVEVEGVRFR